MKRYQRAQDARILQRLLMLIHVKEGKSAAEMVKVTNETIGKWVKRFYAEGFGGLEDRERFGRPTIIDYDDVGDVIDNHTPEDFGYPHQGWFPLLLYQYLIDYQDQEEMHFEYVYEIIDRAGYILRMPRSKHHKQDEEVVRLFKKMTQRVEETKPQQFAVVDECSINLSVNIDKIIAKEGSKPVIETEKTYNYGISIGAAITASQELKYQIKENRMNSGEFKDYLFFLKQDHDPYNLYIRYRICWGYTLNNLNRLGS